MFEPTSERSLSRVLGLREAVTLGLGGTIGGGIFVLVGSAAGQAGPAILLAFVLAFAFSLVIALPYAEVACRFPQARHADPGVGERAGRHRDRADVAGGRVAWTVARGGAGASVEVGVEAVVV